MKNVLVIGLGEVGKPLVELLENSKKYKVFKKDIAPIEIKEPIDVMHICIPFLKNFVDLVVGYTKQYKPQLTIINSTVRPGTTQQIYKKTRSLIVHSPVRGKHPKMKEGLLKFVKFIGPINKKAAELAAKHFESIGVVTARFKSPLETEVGKLLETTYYAINIAAHQEMWRICKKFGADFTQAVTEFNATQTMDIAHKVPRPLMWPGKMGGHCVIPNIEILKQDIGSELIDAVIASNMKQKPDPRELKKIIRAIKEKEVIYRSGIPTNFVEIVRKNAKRRKK